MGVGLAVVTKEFCIVFRYFSDHTYLRYSKEALKVAKSKLSLSSTLTSFPPLLGFQICSKCRLKNGDSIINFSLA